MKRFPAKLLLFGEHTVLKGASALAIPFRQFGGSWKQGAAPEGQPDIGSFLEYLGQLHSEGNLILTLDLKRMEEELQNGLYFESDIPMGYGLGSSGAFCAAVNFRFGEPPSKLEIKPLQEGLAQMESYFHGSSSGTDPLISYLQVPLTLSGGKAYPPLWQKHTEELMERFFLLDSRVPRESNPLIQQFLQRFEDPLYASAVQNHLIPANDKAIKNLLSGDPLSLEENMGSISRFQLEHMPWMVLPELERHWKAGLRNHSFYLKVCGAGGGGFYLGYARDQAATQSYFDRIRQPLIWLEES